MRHRMLKYTPEHLHCDSHWWGPVTPQATGFLAIQSVADRQENFKIVEMETSIYQLGYDSVTLSGDHLMNAGLPVKFYTLDDSVMFVIKQYDVPEKK